MTASAGGSPKREDPVGDSLPQQLGPLLSGLRHQAALTISALAALADVSPGLISQLERGQGNPSYTTMLKLARALDTPVGRLFGVEERDPRHGVVRADARRHLVFSEANMVYELLTPTMRGNIGMIQARIAAGWSNEDVPYTHDGEECIVLLEGRLHANIGGTEYDIRVGDSLTYDSGLPHWWRNETDESALMLAAMTPPSF